MHRPLGHDARPRRLAMALQATALALGALLWTPACADDGRFHLVAGDVVVSRTGPGGTVSVRRPVGGDVVSAGDRIDTGGNGRAQVRFSDGSIVSLQPGSQFRIDEYRFDAGAQRGFFALVRGSLRTLTGAIGKRDHDDYRLITPTATVGVRGTEFVAEETVCEPDCRPGRSAGLRVAVSEGRVVVVNRSGSTEVAAGAAVHVPSADRPAQPTTERPVLTPTGMRGGGTVAEASARATAARAARLAGIAGQDGTSATRAGMGAPASAAAIEGAPARLAMSSATTGIPQVAGRSATAPQGVRGTADPSGGQSGVAADSDAPERAPAATAPLELASDPSPRAADAPAEETVATSGPAPRAGGSIGAGTWLGDLASAAIRAIADTAAAASAASAGPRMVAAVPTAPPTEAGPARRDPAPPSTDAGSLLDVAASAQSVSPNAIRTDGGLLAAVVVPLAATLQAGIAPGAPFMAAPPRDAASGTGSATGAAAGTGGSAGSAVPTAPVVPTASVAPTVSVAPTTPVVPTDPPASTDAIGPADSGLPAPVPPLQLSAGLLDARLLRIELRHAPGVTEATLSARAARIGLDADMRLQSIGLCPDVLCLSRGRASVADAGNDGIASWGRWIDGPARASVMGVSSDPAQSARAGMHYLVGIPTLTMPTQGSGFYQLAGATQPTFSDGSRAPGIFLASAIVQFATGHNTRVGYESKVQFEGDARYRFSSTGGLANPGASNLTMTGTNSFRGTLEVLPDNPSNALGCTPTNPCRAAVSGGFLGPEAARLGIAYTVGGTGQGGTTISGVGVLRRNP